MADPAHRRRGAELERALLEAAWAELTDKGYAKFTMDAVAVRAGTSRPVLYRRWPDRHALLRDTLGHLGRRDAVVAPDTGSLRGDMLALMRTANDTRAELIALVSVHLGGYFQETGSSPAELGDAVFPERPLHAILDTIYQRAAERGEIDPDRVSARMRTLPLDLLRAEVLVTFRPMAAQDIAEIVDTLFLPLVLAQ